MRRSSRRSSRSPRSMRASALLPDESALRRGDRGERPCPHLVACRKPKRADGLARDGGRHAHRGGGQRGPGFAPCARCFGPPGSAPGRLPERAPPGRLLYLAGRDRRPDIEEALRREARTFVLVEVYDARLAAALPSAAAAALRDRALEAVLHYSARSAKAYVALATAAGLLSQALGPAQLCLSGAVARPLVEAGANCVKLAAFPDEPHLLALLPGQRRA